MLAEAEVPVVPEAAPDEVQAVAPVDGEGVPGLVCDVLLLPAVPVVPVVPVVVPVVPVLAPVVLHGAADPVTPAPVPLGFMVDGCEVVPEVGVFGEVEPGTLWLVVLPGGVAVLP